MLSLYAKGLTTGEISAHFAEIYGASISRETVSRITGKVVAEMAEWATRPLDAVYVAIFIDAIVVRVRDGQVASLPVYAAIGVTIDGRKDVLGLWAGAGGEGARFWMSVLTDLKNRGVKEVFFLVCDGLKGLPEVVGSVWPLAIVQTCIIHLIRNTFRLTSRADVDAIKRDIRPIYTAPNADAASAALAELEEKWGDKYGAMIRLWRNAWNEFIPFLDYDTEIRKVICSTNAIESLNARYRRAVRARGHFPSEQAADLNRWLPLVKWLLAIPHYIVLFFLEIAAFFAVIATWFAILFTGRYPRRVFSFVEGVFRWHNRVAAYAFVLVTDRYPPFRLAP